ncbi:phage baseplate protein [Flavobacterium gilvum]|uniref:Baseplate structural protein Gp10 C-terminal domain-containing protein n=1 Tax=Flavobacterium gilvum TaxID=1492737 RepID=A0AAC9N3F8_9FLAO|nr:hypothetical protein [Flavobacterium gilvum]AOW08755.1 hypothetical protein EM308_04140 [Flavobacterium gilvum]KFC59804.1 hypothetical protein FEM08_13150 [Flavobacterium gilvum]
MILIDLLQAGGYRFKQATLRKMQTAYFEILKAFVKHLDMPDEGNFIISGCTIVGDNITSGMMYIDGELCEFAETPGTADSLIKKNVAYTNLVFKSGSSLPVFRATNAMVVEVDGVALSAFTRIQTVKNLVWGNIADKPDGIVTDPNFGIPDTQTLIERIIALEERPLANVPIGLVAIWGLPADEIPAGWVEHAPLFGKMPIGKDLTDPDFDSTEGVGAVGGSKDHTLTIAQMPEHDHDTQTPVDGGGGADMQSSVESSGSDERLIPGPKTGKTGGGEAFSIMPPYRVVDYIRYVGTEA